MPRQPRVVLPGYPHHVIQRGHNQAPVFLERADHRFYLQLLADWKARLGCKVYAYCLMTNHVHLVIDPGETAKKLALLMKRVAGRYTRHVNNVEQRSGTAWNGRFSSSPIDTDRYLMACCRYVELNPVRAGMVSVPQDYPWSSYRHKVGQSLCQWLDEDPCYTELGSTPSERVARYHAWVLDSIPDGEWQFIRAAARRGQLTGDKRFREAVSRRLGRRIASRGPGRPKRRDEK